MQYLKTRRFQRQFPGPFTIFDGNDGVDSTHDVICLTTGERIISTYYWENAKEAALVANVVSTALNQPVTNSRWLVELASNRRLPTFFTDYPGPFKVNRDRCPYQGECYEIRCQSTGQSVIHRPNLDSMSNTKFIITHLARSLNHLNKEHQLAQKEL